MLIPSVTKSCAQDSSLTEHTAMLNSLLMRTEQQHTLLQVKLVVHLNHFLCHQALGQGYQISDTDLKVQNMKLGH